MSLGVSVASVLVAEAGWRGWLWLSGEPYHAEDTVRALRGLLEEMNTDLPGGGELERDVGLEHPRHGKFVLHPYFGYDIPGGQFKVEKQAAYYRSPERERDFCIMLFGGSVAELFGSARTGGGRRLIEILESDPRIAGRSVKLQVFARAGFKQPQQLEQLAYLLSLGCRPDVVITVDGSNEIALTLRNVIFNYPVTYPSVDHWAHVTQGSQLDRRGMDLLLTVRSRQLEAESLVERSLDRGLHRSAILGSEVLVRLRRKHGRWAAARDAYTRHLVAAREEQSLEIARPEAVARRPPPRTQWKFDTALEESVAVWFESSLSMRDLCVARSIRFVHALQPTLLDPRCKLPTQEERRSVIRDSDQGRRVAAGYRLMRERGGDLLAAGVEFRDLSRMFAQIEETVFYDSVHFGREGNAILARELAEAIADGMD